MEPINLDFPPYPWNRRTFLRSLGASGALALSGLGTIVETSDAAVRFYKEARYYRPIAEGVVRCLLCPRQCAIEKGERGFCRTRENRHGRLVSLVYGYPCTMHIDPIEKKPLFHFLPGGSAFSMATVGCNVRCLFCQNWEISQARPEDVKSYDLPPEKAAELAHSKQSDCIAYTYSEPVVSAEYLYDTATAAAELSVRNVMITNGYINAEPMRDLCRVLDAVKIDLKAFSNRFYYELVDGELQPVLDTLVILKAEGIWTEIVYLVIPGQNDSPDELKKMCKWVHAELGANTPVHFTRFHPQYRLKNLPSTPIASLRQAREIGLDCGLHFCYTGNIPGDAGEHTYCPSCNKVLIRRRGFIVLENHLKDGKCDACATSIPGVWH
ncbi:AmmeMemoRadiSam system radical SAM enzyme [candidate division KSB1 bacterium]|nr:AmmeMemoRadiSam system radical SAM enzyme [candidate division KSB1 bacterium]